MATTRQNPFFKKPTALQTIVDGTTAAWVRRRAGAERIAVSTWVRRLIERERERDRSARRIAARFARNPNLKGSKT